MFKQTIRKQICRLTGKQFEISPGEAERFSYFALPLPDLCPQERARTRLAFANEWRFYWRRCSASGKKIYSAFPQSTSFPVYDLQLWLSSQFDPFSYGRDLVPNKPFFEQLSDLWTAVPRPSLRVSSISESTAIHDAERVTHSYWITSSHDVLNCYYSSNLSSCEFVCDCDFVTSSNHCYECLDCHNSDHLYWSEHCLDCSRSSFLSHCKSCSDCLFCANLEGRNYCFFNEQLSREEFEQCMNGYNFGNRQELEEAKDKFAGFLHDKPVPHIETDAAEWTALTGNCLYNTPSAVNAFFCKDSRDLWSCCNLFRAENCLEGLGFGLGLCDSAQFVNVGLRAQRILNSVECWGDINDLNYCSYCTKCSNCFGCVGLNGQQFCVLNKQYSEKEYWELLRQIQALMNKKRSYGHFLPVSFSGIPYNLSAANDYMPLNKVQAALMGLAWDEAEDNLKPSQLLEQDGNVSDKFGDVPLTADELEPDLAKDALFLCEITAKPFRFFPKEWEFYLQHSIAPPARCFEQRRGERVHKSGLRRLVQRVSEKSKCTLLSAYPAEWRQPVYERGEWLAEINPQMTLIDRQ